MIFCELVRKWAHESHNAQVTLYFYAIDILTHQPVEPGAQIAVHL